MFQTPGCTSAAGREVGGEVALVVVAASSCQGDGTQNNIIEAIYEIYLISLYKIVSLFFAHLRRVTMH